MGLFEHFPYTNFHDLNLDWILKKIKELLNAKVPTGGKTNQVLTKKSNADYDMVWKDAPALPTGGTDGQLLVKDGSADYSARWESPEESVGDIINNLHQLPAGGTTGQVLTKNSDSDYDAVWRDSSGGVPDGGEAGQVLAKRSATNQDTEWVNQDFLPLAGGVMDEGATIKLPNASGSSTTISPNRMSHDGADTFVLAGAFQVAGTMKGNTPVDPADFATKKYVDDHGGGGGGGGDEYVKKTGDTMTGPLVVDVSGQVAGTIGLTVKAPQTGGTKGIEVDSLKPLRVNMNNKWASEIEICNQTIKIADSFNVTGGEMKSSPNIIIDTSKGVRYPKPATGSAIAITDDDQLVTKAYVDQAIAGAKQAIAASLTMKGYTAAGAAIDPPTEV